jgi:hypothetical protein
MTCLVTTYVNVNAQTPLCKVELPPDKQAACFFVPPGTGSLPRFLLEVLLSESRRQIYNEEYFESLGEVFEDTLPLKEVLENRITGRRGSLKSKIDNTRYFIIHTVSTTSDQAQDRVHEIIAPDADDFRSLQTNKGFQFYIDARGRIYHTTDLNMGTPLRVKDGNREFRIIDLGKTINVGIESEREGNKVYIETETAEALVLSYLAASIRSRRWLIPAFHGAFEPTFAPDIIIPPNYIAYWDRFLWSQVLRLENAVWVKYQETQLGNKLANYEAGFRESIIQLPRVNRSLPNGYIVQGYDAKKVNEAVLRNKSDLIAGLNNEEYAGLRAYVTRYFPLSESPLTLQTTRNSEASLIKISNMVAGYPTEMQEAIISPTTLDKVVERVMSFYSKLNNNKKAIDLEISSMPVGATVTLTTAGGKGRTIDTNSRITNIFRGLYNYTIHKEGFKTIKREINLVDERGTKLECSLGITDAGSCQLR